MSCFAGSQLRNVAREIRKGERMEFDQFFYNASNMREKDARIRPFQLGPLVEAFRLKETPHVDMRSAEKEIESKDREMKRKKHTDRDKYRERLKNTLLNNDKTNLKDLKSRTESGPDKLKKEHKV